jgi:hypothetical protein
MPEGSPMKCPQCGYVSFPYWENCRKCGKGLAEQRAALGLYALRPDPPDLLLAYQAMNADASRVTLTPSVSTPAIDLGQLDEIELELVENEASTQDTPQGGDQTDAVVDRRPTPMLEPTPEALPPTQLSAERASPPEIGISPSLDLSELGDITLELENAAEPGIESPESPQPPPQPPEAKQVYDLDLDEDPDGLTLGPTIQESRTDDQDEETVEYTLEIEDDLELEVDELEIEEDDEAEEEDEDER